MLVFSYLFTATVRGNSNETIFTVQPSMSRSREYECPPWFFYNTSTENCECYHSPSTEKIVKCTDQGALLQIGNCMTHEEEEGTFVGLCYYFELEGHNESETFPGFITLPDNVSELNDYMCGPLNREGLLCSECAEGFGLTIFSPRPTCFSCDHGKMTQGVILYLFFAFVPVTVVYFFLLVLDIGFLTSAPFTAFLLFSQIGFTFLTSNNFDPDSVLNSHSVLNVYVKSLITFYGFWDLDFFLVYFIPPLCITKIFNTIGVLYYLRYFVVYLYFIVLYLLTIVCIILHSKNVKLIVWTWKIISPLLKKVKRDSTSTFVNIFCTYILLSYSKSVQVLFVSYYQYISLYSKNNFPVQKVLFLYPNIKFLSFEHIVFIAGSLFSFMVIFVPPVMVLALYPSRRCRSLCFTCSCSCTCIGHARAELNMYVEKFYSCYRDGLDGGWDLRAFASLYFIVRIIFVLVSFFNLTPSASYSGDSVQYYSSLSSTSTAYALLLGGTAVVIATFRPYKKNYMNIIDTLLFVDMAFIFLMLGNWKSPFALEAAVIAGSIPMWGFLGFGLYKIVPFQRLFTLMKKKTSYTNVFCQKYCFCYKIKRGIELDETADNGNLDVCYLEIPDRVLNPEDYEADIAM